MHRISARNSRLSISAITIMVGSSTTTAKLFSKFHSMSRLAFKKALPEYYSMDRLITTIGQVRKFQSQPNTDRRAVRFPKVCFLFKSKGNGASWTGQGGSLSHHVLKMRTVSTRDWPRSKLKATKRSGAREMWKDRVRDSR